MSTASLFVNVLYVMAIVGIVVVSKSHHCFGVNVGAAAHKCSCKSAIGHGLPFFLITSH